MPRTTGLSPATFVSIAALLLAATGGGFTLGQSLREAEIGRREHERQGYLGRIAQLEARVAELEERLNKREQVARPEAAPALRPVPVRALDGGHGSSCKFNLAASRLTLCKGTSWRSPDGAVTLSLRDINTAGAPARGIVLVRDGPASRLADAIEGVPLSVRAHGRLVGLPVTAVRPDSGAVDIDVTLLLR